VLVGARGLLPARDFLAAADGFLAAPTVFWLASGDRVLVAGAVAGALLGLALACGRAPRWCLAALWGLYLSFVTVGQDFLAFQWDNLLLESALVGFVLAPGAVRPRRAPPPHPLAVFLALWLLFRLHVESGLAKLLLGDPSWRDLTAMATYYETAPLPTWVGWWVHQLPLRVHQLSGLFVYLVELVVPLFLWGPARLRVAAFALMVAMQGVIALTANYAIFNYLSMALALFALDDTHLAWVARRFGRPLVPLPPRPLSRARSAALGVMAVLLVPLSIVQFLPFVPPLRERARNLAPVRRVLNTVRSVNAYHLFAQMTLVRREPVIEGSDDGVTWRPYEFHYKPGDPDRRPPFVAPHQPRVDFQAWFLLLGRRGGARWFDTLLARLLEEPKTVGALFAHDPFGGRAPGRLRVAFWRYRFGASWWQRDLEGYSREFRARSP
jgi:hypothetical protein